MESLQNHIVLSGSAKPVDDAVQALRDAEGSSKENINWLKGKIKGYSSYKAVVGNLSPELKDRIQFERFWAEVRDKL